MATPGWAESLPAQASPAPVISSATLQYTWPFALAKLVADRGEAAVWETGLEALKYPPTWAATAREFQAVKVAILTRKD